MQKMISPRHVELAHVSRNDWIVLAVVIQDYIIVYIYMCNESCRLYAMHFYFTKNACIAKRVPACEREAVSGRGPTKS